MTETQDRLEERQIDAALRFYVEQFPAYAAAAGLGNDSAVMLDVNAVRALRPSVLAALRQSQDIEAADPGGYKALRMLGHEPVMTIGDECFHRWRNRTTRRVHCPFLAGFRAALLRAALIPKAEEAPR